MMDDAADAPVGVGAPLLSLSDSSDINGDKPAALPGFEWVLKSLAADAEGEPGSGEGEDCDGASVAAAAPGDPFSAPCFLCHMAVAAPGNLYKVQMDAMVDEGSMRIGSRELYEEVAMYAQESVFRRAMTDPAFRSKNFKCNAAVAFVHYNMHDIDMRRGAAQDIRDIRELKWVLRSTAVDQAPDGKLKRPSIDVVRTLDLLIKAEAAAHARHGTAATK